MSVFARFLQPPLPAASATDGAGLLLDPALAWAIVLGALALACGLLWGLSAIARGKTPGKEQPRGRGMSRPVLTAPRPRQAA